MGKSLVIVESPAKASTIKKFLGRNYKVIASVGHVMDLPKNELGVDVDNGFSPKYVVSKGKQKILTQIKKDAKNSDEVLLALDMDREGEAIAWHLQQALSKAKVTIKRIVFNEITREAIKEATEGDLVVIAGKGHETTQTVLGRVERFDDREIAAELLDARPGGGHA